MFDRWPLTKLCLICIGSAVATLIVALGFAHVAVTLRVSWWSLTAAVFCVLLVAAVCVGAWERWRAWRRGRHDG